ERTSSNTPHRNECHSHPDKDARKQSDLFVPTIWFRNIVYLNVRRTLLIHDVSINLLTDGIEHGIFVMSLNSHGNSYRECLFNKFSEKVVCKSHVMSPNCF